MAGLVARGEELARLAAAVATPPSVAAVSGEAGVGKTRLVAELRDRTAGTGRRFVVGRCRQVREPFPLGPVLDVLRHGDLLPAPETLSAVVGALRPLLPEIADRLPRLPPPLDDPLDQRHRVFRAVVQLLAAAGPVTVVLEDLHWADEQTVDLLGYLLRDPPPELALVLTYRDEEVDPRLPAVVAATTDVVSRTRIGLAPLDASETGALAAAILGEPRVSVEFAAHLRERTGGLPFAVEEVLALLQERGSLIHRGGRWQRQLLSELDVPAGIRDSVRERLGRLSACARALADAAAVLHVPVPADLLGATSRCPLAQAPQGLAEALAARLLVESTAGSTGSEIGYRHLLAAQAAYDEIPLPRRQDLHARAAVALRQRHPVPLGQVAHHLQQAGRTDEWVAVAEQAADQATALGDGAQAADLLEEVLRETPLVAAHQGRLAVKLARVISIAGPGREQALALLWHTLDLPLAREVRGELQCRLAIVYDEEDADWRPLHRLLVDAVDDLADQPELRAWAMLALASTPLPGRGGDTGRWLEQAVEVLPTVANRHGRVYLLGKAAMLQAAKGDRGWPTLVRQLGELTGGAPDEPRELSAYWSVGLLAGIAGHHEEAGRLLAAAGRAEVATGASEHRRLAYNVAAAQVLLGYLRGAWDGLDGRIEHLTGQFADRPGRQVEIGTAAGGLMLARGDLNVAGQLLSEAAGEAKQRRMTSLLPIPASGLMRLALARGCPAEAATHAHRIAAATAAQDTFWVSTVRALPEMVRALAAASEATTAEQVVTDWQKRLHGLDAPLAAAAFPQARGSLAATEGRWLVAAAEFRTAADRYDRLQCPYEAAQAREQAAAVPAEDGSTDQGAAELLAALATYRRLGATGDASRAAGTARARGISVPAAHRGGRRGYGDALSPQEQAIAELVARQRTNQEIAVEMYVSVKTVEGHVSSVLRKLGVASRRAVAARLPGSDG